MNRLILTMVLMFILIVPQAWAQTTQYPNPYRQTSWNSFTDAIHTMGQTPQQAAWTKKKLHRARTRARLNSINKARHQGAVYSS